MARAGTVTFLAIDNAAGTPTNIQPYCDNISIPNTAQMLETSAMGTQPKAFIGGLTNGDQISVSGPYAVAIWAHFGSLIAAQNAGTASHSFLYGPGGSVSGEGKQTGEFLVAGFNPSSTVGGRVEWSATLQVTGAVTTSTW